MYRKDLNSTYILSDVSNIFRELFSLINITYKYYKTCFVFIFFFVNLVRDYVLFVHDRCLPYEEACHFVF